MEFSAHGKPVSCCRFLDRDRLIVTGSHDKTIAIWVSIIYHCVCVIAGATPNSQAQIDFDVVIVDIAGTVQGSSHKMLFLL